MKPIALVALLALAACAAPNPLQPAVHVEPAQGIAVGEPHPAAPKPMVAPGCKIGGCSSQLCTNANMPDMASTCEWRQTYACYQSATCEKQSDGNCGWTQTTALQLCLQEAEIYRP